MSVFTKRCADDTRTVTVTPDPEGLRVQRGGTDGVSPFPVRIVTSRPDHYASAIVSELTAEGYRQVTS